jgi:hypothetical protein
MLEIDSTHFSETTDARFLLNLDAQNLRYDFLKFKQ